MVYKNRQYTINLLTIKITKWGTKNKVVENTPKISDIIGVNDSRRKTYCTFSKVVTFEEMPKFWGMENRRKWCKERTNQMRSKTFPERSWFHGLTFFIHQFMSFVLLLLLHNSGKLTIPHDHILLLLQIIFDCQFQKVVLLVLQQWGNDCVIICSKLKPFIDRWTWYRAMPMTS